MHTRSTEEGLAQETKGSETLDLPYPNFREEGLWGKLELEPGTDEVHAYGYCAEVTEGVAALLGMNTPDPQFIERQRVLAHVKTDPWNGGIDRITYLLPYDYPRTPRGRSKIWAFKTFASGSSIRIVSAHQLMQLDGTLVEGMMVDDSRNGPGLGYFLPQDQIDLIQDIALTD